jgi:oxygen-independent coproporphyrinogen III oxidase
MGDLLALAERAVPRYTSYPTAPHFSAAVDAGTYTRWLAELPETAEISLYLHVPYCANLCLYCGCHTKAVRRDGPLDQYANWLAREIELVKTATAARRIKHLHWGGGTPSILGEARLEQIATKIADAFDTSKMDEHAIELDPRRLSPSLARALKRIGISRASLGVQDLAPHVQRAIGRVQTFEQVSEAVGLLRAAGINRTNIDLMYGLPHQRVADVEATVSRIASLEPQRIALFGYAHVPWFKTHQRRIDAAALPGPGERVQQVRAAAAVLATHGYVAIGIDHFARPDDDLVRALQSGNLRRNFQGYTTAHADALIGLGASAIGRLPQSYAQNFVDIRGYGRAIDDGRLATAKGIALSPDDHIRGRIIERLMCDLAVDLAAFADPGAFADERNRLAEFSAQGLVRMDGPRIQITEAGRPFTRLVAAAFDAYLPQNQARHSIAV